MRAFFPAARFLDDQKTLPVASVGFALESIFVNLIDYVFFVSFLLIVFCAPCFIKVGVMLSLFVCVSFELKRRKKMRKKDARFNPLITFAKDYGDRSSI